MQSARGNEASTTRMWSPTWAHRSSSTHWPSWAQAPLSWGAPQVVLFAIDGLGFEQLTERLPVAPTLAAMAGGSILTVAPSTTATALSSLALGTSPGEHGVVGYRINVKGDVLNVLRWQ